MTRMGVFVICTKEPQDDHDPDRPMRIFGIYVDYTEESGIARRQVGTTMDDSEAFDIDGPGGERIDEMEITEYEMKVSDCSPTASRDFSHDPALLIWTWTQIRTNRGRAKELWDMPLGGMPPVPSVPPRA